MKLIVEIDTAGAAFSVGDPGMIAAAGWQGGAEVEAARLVKMIAGQIETGIPSGVLMDGNGNTVGGWSIDETPEPAPEPGSMRALRLLRDCPHCGGGHRPGETHNGPSAAEAEHARPMTSPYGRICLSCLRLIETDGQVCTGPGATYCRVEGWRGPLFNRPNDPDAIAEDVARNHAGHMQACEVCTWSYCAHYACDCGHLLPFVAAPETVSEPGPDGGIIMRPAGPCDLCADEITEHGSTGCNVDGCGCDWAVCPACEGRRDDPHTYRVGCTAKGVDRA
jgi:hypothetical protein